MGYGFHQVRKLPCKLHVHSVNYSAKHVQVSRAFFLVPFVRSRLQAKPTDCFTPYRFFYFLLAVNLKEFTDSGSLSFINVFHCLHWLFPFDMLKYCGSGDLLAALVPAEHRYWLLVELTAERVLAEQTANIKQKEANQSCQGKNLSHSLRFLYYSLMLHLYLKIQEQNLWNKSWVQSYQKRAYTYVHQSSHRSMTQSKWQIQEAEWQIQTTPLKNDVNSYGPAYYEQ
jgi:hypothetical protein